MFGAVLFSGSTYPATPCAWPTLHRRASRSRSRTSAIAFLVKRLRALDAAVGDSVVAKPTIAVLGAEEALLNKALCHSRASDMASYDTFCRWCIWCHANESNCGPRDTLCASDIVFHAVGSQVNASFLRDTQCHWHKVCHVARRHAAGNPISAGFSHPASR